jgi:1,4-dihydroxy-2-naphthoate octaprenyltransferase
MLQSVSRFHAWAQAARPLAQVNIAIPLLVGQALAFAATGAFSWVIFALVHLAGVLDHLYIVFANDVADEAGDRDNEIETAFSGGSRVLREGKLDAAALRRAAIGMAVVLGIVAVFTAVMFDRLALVPLWAGAILLLWAYSYRPLALSYRGFGETAQGLGVGIMLPLIGFFAQTGSFDGFVWPALAPLFVLGFASNITTSLPDHAADASHDKRTWPVRFGLSRAAKHALQLTAIATLMTPFVLPDASRSVWATVEAAPALALLANFMMSRRPGSNDRSALVRFIVLNGAAANLVMLGWAGAAAFWLTR